MAGSSLTAHTRLVPAKRRADTRAKTEPRPLGRGTGSPSALAEAPAKRPPTFNEMTAPYPRSFEPEEEGRESLPYMELTISTRAIDPEGPTERELPTEALPKVVIAAEDKLNETQIADSEERPTGALPRQSLRDDDEEDLETAALEKQPAPGELVRSTSAIAKQVADAEAELDLDRSTERVVKMLESLTEPNGPKPRPSKLMWLGVVLTPPVVGAALVIGTWLRPEFCVTSPITHVFPREDGTLVQTATKSRYFVGPDGDTYIVRRNPQP